MPAWQGKGIARAIHDELLGGSGAERATLTVRPTATLRGSASEVAAAVRSILDEYLPG